MLECVCVHTRVAVCLQYSSSYLQVQIGVCLRECVFVALLALSPPASLWANISALSCLCHCEPEFVCRLYVDHLISLLASCALTSIPSLSLLLSLMGDLAILGWHLAYSLFSCHGYAGLWIAPLLLWPCCGCYRCLNYWTAEQLNTKHAHTFKRGRALE